MIKPCIECGKMTAGDLCVNCLEKPQEVDNGEDKRSVGNE